MKKLIEAFLGYLVIGSGIAHADSIALQNLEHFTTGHNNSQSIQSNGSFVLSTQTGGGIYEYRGVIEVTSIDTAYTTNCNNAGWGVGSWNPARFSPNGVGSNGNYWKLSMHNDVWAESYSYYGAPSSSLATVYSSAWVGRGSGSFSVTPKIAISTQNPTSISTSTKSVYIEGKIWNIGNNASQTSGSDACQITFRFSGTLVP